MQGKMVRKFRRNKNSFHKAYERSGFEAAPHAGKGKPYSRKSWQFWTRKVRHNGSPSALEGPWFAIALLGLCYNGGAFASSRCATPSYALMHSATCQSKNGTTFFGGMPGTKWARVGVTAPWCGRLWVRERSRILHLINRRPWALFLTRSATC